MNNFGLNKYDEVLAMLIDEKFNGQTIETAFTKRIKSEDYKQCVFANEPTHPQVLKLISMIRKDAEKFIKSDKSAEITKKTTYEIEFYQFVDRSEFTNNKLIEGTKIDLNEAYWQTGLNMGLISVETDDFLYSIFWGLDFLGNPLSEEKIKKKRKKARLKALGSLATRQKITDWADGKIIDKGENEENPRIETKDLQRQLYLTICDLVANVMGSLIYEFFENVIYYYWDCIFVDSKINESKIFESIEKLGYKAKVEGRTNFKINKFDVVANILDTKTNIDYPIDKDSVIYKDEEE